MASDTPRTIVVVGATGVQGWGVVEALLSGRHGGHWHVNALTRDPDSTKSQELLSKLQTSDKRLSLVRGYPYDAASLQDAFSGAHGVFAMTSERHPDKIIYDEEDMKHEITAGQNMIHAAKTCGVKHFVFSTLPNMIEVTGGQFSRIHHMNNKAVIEDLARKELDCFTGLIPGFFYNNLKWPQYSRLQADGVVRLCAPVPGSQTCQWTDPTHDMGAFAAKIFALGVEKTKEKTYFALSPGLSGDDMASIFTRVTGRPAIYSPSSSDEFAELTTSLVGPAFKEDAKQMMEWAAVMPKDRICYGSLSPEVDKSKEELGLQATSFEDWLRRSGWTGPTEVYE